MLPRSQVIQVSLFPAHLTSASAFVLLIVLCVEQVSCTDQHFEFLASGLDDRARYTVTLDNSHQHRNKFYSFSGDGKLLKIFVSFSALTLLVWRQEDTWPVKF